MGCRQLSLGWLIIVQIGCDARLPSVRDDPMPDDLGVADVGGDAQRADAELDARVDHDLGTPNLLGAKTITAGAARTCLIDVEGAVWCWGIGIGPIDPPIGLPPDPGAPRDQPASLSRLDAFTGALDISSDYGQICVVDARRRLWCRRPAGVFEKVAIEPVVEVDVGANGCARNTDGAVFCQQADGWSRVRGLEATQLAGGLQHMCALDPAGRAWCWGRNRRGQLGDGSTEDSDVPVAVMAPVPFVRLASTYENTCGVSEAGGVYCWGTINLMSRPTQVPGLGGAVDVGLGIGAACAITASGAVDCWRSANPDVVERQPGLDDAIAIDGSVAHLCVSRADGRVACWGSNSAGQAGAPMRLEDGAVVDVDLPDVVHVSATDERVCAVTGDGQLWCWGGQGTESGTPTRLEGLGPVRSVDLGARTSCAQTVDGALWCWGHIAGRADEPFDTPQPMPELDPVATYAVGRIEVCVTQPGADRIICIGAAGGLCSVEQDYALPGVEQLVTGDNFACARDADAVYCWGALAGLDRQMCQVEAVGMAGARRIAAGGLHVCGLHDDAIRCVGDVDPPIIEGDFVAVAVSVQKRRDPIGGLEDDGQTVCGITREDGRARCVGGLRWTPETLEGATQLAIGQGFGCALREERTVMCWGRNSVNQLGDSIGRGRVEVPYSFSVSD